MKTSITCRKRNLQERSTRFFGISVFAPPGFLRSVSFQETCKQSISRTPSQCGSLTSPPALWREQRAVPGTLCQGPGERGLPETSRRPRREEKRMGEGRETLCDTEEEAAGRRGGKEARPPSDERRAASACQSPKIVASDDQTEDTRQTTALRSSEHRRTHTGRDEL